jgi:hypothetical protein
MISVSNLPILFLSAIKARTARAKDLSTKNRKPNFKRTFVRQASLRYDNTNKKNDSNFSYNFLRACPSTYIYERDTNWFSLIE